MSFRSDLGRALLVAGALAGAPAVAGAETAPAPRDPPITAGVSLTFWFPQADADDSAESSPGFRVAGEYWFRPFVALVVSFDWVFVQEKEIVGDADIQYYSIGIGARATTPAPAAIKPFGELMIHRATLTVDDFDYDESDLGFRLGGGALFRIGSNLEAIGEITYSAVEIENQDIDALSIEAGIRGRF